METRLKLRIQSSGYVGLGVTLLFLLIQQGQVTASDGSDMLAVSQSILHHASVVVPRPYGVLGRGGHYYAKYGIGLSVVVIPFIALGDLIAIVIGHKATLESFMAASTVPVMMGLMAASLWRIATRLGATRAWATIISIGAVFGTYALPYGKDFFAEPLTALAIVLCIEQILKCRPWLAGVALAFAIVARPECLVLLGVFSLIILWEQGLTSALALAVAGSVGALVDTLYDYLRFNNFFNSGYGSESFATPFLHGASGLLFSPEKSIFLFAPVIVLCFVGGVVLWSEYRLVVELTVANFVVFFVLAATWHSWQGGWSWGPRLVLPGVIPLVLLLAGLVRWWRTAAISLFALGFIVSASTILVPTQAQQLFPNPPADGPSIIRQYQLIPTVSNFTFHHLFHGPTGGGSHRMYLFLWQVNLARELGKPGLLLGIVGTIAIIGLVIGIVTMSRRRRYTTPQLA